MNRGGWVGVDMGKQSGKLEMIKTCFIKCKILKELKTE